nr:hypothetical protein [Verrucosispora sp. NA02020]
MLEAPTADELHKLGCLAEPFNLAALASLDHTQVLELTVTASLQTVVARLHRQQLDAWSIDAQSAEPASQVDRCADLYVLGWRVANVVDDRCAGGLTARLLALSLQQVARQEVVVEFVEV